MQEGYGCIFFHSSNFLSLNFHWGLPGINKYQNNCFRLFLVPNVTKSVFFMAYHYDMSRKQNIFFFSFFFLFFFGFCKYKFGNDLSKSWETFSQIGIQEFDNVRLFMPSLLQKFFKKTKTTTKPFHHSPAYAKYREREKLVLPSSFPLSSNEERVKRVFKSLKFALRWKWLWIPTRRWMAVQS